jgi:hypothetical protein
MKTLPVVLLLAATLAAQEAPPPPPSIPAAYWSEAKSKEILDKTVTIRLAPDLSGLPENEKAALKRLFEVGSIIQQLYESERHPEALTALEKLRTVDARLGSPTRTKNLRTLYRLFQGPIATTLDNKREPFLDVAPPLPGKNVYPLDITKQELDAFLAAHPEMRTAILDARTVVRRETKANLNIDINGLQVYSILRTLHPYVLEGMRSRQHDADGKNFYAVPYTIAYADPMIGMYNQLFEAAIQLEDSDPELARYAWNRARDLLSNDYESGDASWVTGRFKRLNFQLGAYETYDDALYGVKAFHSMSILLKNEKATADLVKALSGLQSIEDALPYAPHKRVKEDIPIGVYEVIADYGQARGTNTATILPNDPLMARRYGRTILLRENIMRHPEIVAADQRVWRAAMASAHANDYDPEGSIQRTLWHEIGHYLGPDGEALAEYSDSTEEMKADLVSLFALHKMNHPALRAIEASGIRRTLLNTKPRSDEPYGTMQLIQFNWFLDKGLLTFDPKTAQLSIHYDRYNDVVTSLLTEVLKLQKDGNKDAAAAFFQRWTTWTPELHDKIAAKVRTAQGATRFRLVTYAALGE